MPSIYVYTPLISDLVPGKFVAVNENVKANSIMIEQASTCVSLYIPDSSPFLITSNKVSFTLR